MYEKTEMGTDRAHAHSSASALEAFIRHQPAALADLVALVEAFQPALDRLLAEVTVYSVAELAERTPFRARFWRTLIAEGALPHVRLAGPQGQMGVRHNDLAAFIRGRAVAPPAGLR